MKKLLPWQSILLFCLWRFALPVATAQCPAIYGCPTGLAQLCDYTDNDSLMWNTPPFTWAPGISNIDLPEGAVDLTLHVFNPCAANPTVSFVLLLDLDGDNIQETAVSSSALPPPGRVLFNSAFSPTYDEGDTLLFDKRPVPDSMKYQFVLEPNYAGDTILYHIRWTSNSSQISPRLPQGRHRIQWRMVYNNQIRACDYSFRLRDCVSPTLECAPGATISMQNTAPALLHADDLLVSSTDNITPDSLLEFALRRAGTGNGFPLAPGGAPADTLVFECAEAGVQPIELWVRDRAGNAIHCTTPVEVLENPVYCYIAPPSICARTIWDSTLTLSGTEFYVMWQNGNGSYDTLALPGIDSACGELNILPPASSFSLAARRPDDPLNGISTFDLVMISRHILNVTPLAEPWQIVAADVNRNGAVTALDIVELRKLILGITTSLPGQDSLPWRFFDASCTFEGNVFAQFCPTAITLVSQPLTSYPSQIDFEGLKVGDVNGSVDLSAAASQRGNDPHALVIPDRFMQAGSVADVPVYLADGGRWLGAQFALVGDPALLSVEAVLPGAIEAPEAYSALRPESGEVSVSWDAPPRGQPLRPDEPLLQLRLRARRDLSLAGSLRLSNRLQSEAYTEAGALRSLDLTFDRTFQKASSALEEPYPNPMRDRTTFELNLSAPASVELRLVDVTGQTALRQRLELDAGLSRLEILESELPGPGVYAWQIQAGTVVRSGWLLRL